MSQPQSGASAVRPSRAAKVAMVLAIITLAAIVLGPLGAMTGLLPPIGGFTLFAGALVLGSILTLIMGLIGLLTTRARAGRPARSGRSSALTATAIGGALVIFLAVMMSRSGNVPPIHDITTDPNDPPQFVAAAKVAQQEGRAVTYPQGNPNTASLQKAAYPDLEPIGVDFTPQQALERTQKVAQKLGWKVVDTDPGAGRLEATATSRLFHFVDDVVVRIRLRESGSLIDLRSTSRVGQSDIGANAARIRAFREYLTVNE